MSRVKFSAEPSTHPQMAMYDRYAYLTRIPHPVYAHGLACFAEFLATTFFLFLALSGEQVAFSAAYATSTLPSAVDIVLYASLSYAVAFIVSSWIFFRITSSLFNPAITIGMAAIRSLTWQRALLIVVAQFLGAMTAAGLVSAIFPGRLVPSMQLGAGTSTARGFFIELFLTMVFVLMVFVIAGDRHKHTAVVPFGLGFALLSVELSSILFTGGSLNPARAFAVALASHQWPAYHWIYWLAPILGCIPAALLYKLVRALEHETADVKHRESNEMAAAVKNEASEAVATNPAASQSLFKSETTVSPKIKPEPGLSPGGHQLSAVPEHTIEKIATQV